MFIKKDKKSLFSISIFNSFFNKSFFSFILKFLGILQIILLVFFFYIAIALDKNQIKGLLNQTAQITYWFGKTLTSLPVKWSNNIASNHSILNIAIAPKDYQLLMTLRDNVIKKRVVLKEYKKKIPAIINYKNDKFDIKIRLKGDTVEHYEDSKWSMRITLNNDRFMGMKSFSLQDPKRRSYMTSFMLHKFTENENLTTKKFNLVPVAINGKYMGIYNYEEVPDHHMNEFLTGINNIVIRIDDDAMFSDIEIARADKLDSKKNSSHVQIISDYYFSSIIKAHSFNEILNDEILKKDFERASKLLNGLRTGSLAVSEVFDLDKLALYLAMTDLFGAYHGLTFDHRLIYDRNLDRLYPIVWDVTNENTWSSIAFHKFNMFKLDWVFNVSNHTNLTRVQGTLAPVTMIAQMLLDQNLVEKYLTKLDKITSPEYIDNVVEIIKLQVDEYMSILHLDYPQFKIEDEINRLKENANYLRSIYLYPEIPFNAYLSDDDRLNSLILVNRKPIPIKIIALIDITTDQQFRVKGEDSDFILINNMPGVSPTPTKVFFECPMNDCFATRNIKDLRIVAKVVGTGKNTSVKINNWTAYGIY